MIQTWDNKPRKKKREEEHKPDSSSLFFLSQLCSCLQSIHSASLWNQIRVRGLIRTQVTC